MAQTVREIDHELRQEVKEQAGSMLRAARRVTHIASLLAKMRAAFQAKPPKERLLGFECFDDDKDWPESKGYLADCIRPIGLARRQAWKYITVGRTLLPAIGERALREIPIEKAKLLCDVVKAKGTVSPEMLEMARTKTGTELKIEIKKQLYRGNPDHDEGPLELLEVYGPRTWMQELRRGLGVLRKHEGHGPSDAELLCHGIRDEVKRIEEAEEHEREQIAGKVEAPEADDPP